MIEIFNLRLKPPLANPNPMTITLRGFVSNFKSALAVIIRLVGIRIDVRGANLEITANTNAKSSKLTKQIKGGGAQFLVVTL